MTNIPKFRAYVTEQNYMGEVSYINFTDKELSFGVNKDQEELLFDFKDCILIQSTGLTDSKGVEIFEGDICSHKYTRCPILVEYYQLNGFSFGDVGQFDSFTVIGNIYANKELLNEQ